MTARDIQRLLIEARYKQSFCIPNYTPSHWFESDIYEITSAGYFVEYEIKISVADFKQDAKKRKEKITLERNKETLRFEKVEHPQHSKHELLNQKHPIGPSRFYYVCPQGLIKKEMLPAWAGLIEVHKWEHEGISSLTELEKVKAPNLHREKVSEEIKAHAKGVCYWRFNALFCRENCECDQLALMTGCQHTFVKSRMKKGNMLIESFARNVARL